MAEKTCPNCGGPIPAHAPGGHCPRCLLMQGVDEDRPGTDRGLDGEMLDLPSTSGGDPSATLSHSVQPPGALETIAHSIGPVPHVQLRDTELGVASGPVVRPAGANADASTRYRIDGEIARGGMGAVLKGRDPDLGRDVAIKVLHEKLRDNGDLVRRFVEEAQIGGQLQHPGVVPIYELGTFADQRPFFAMKLVKGQTLAELLAERRTLASGGRQPPDPATETAGARTRGDAERVAGAERPREDGLGRTGPDVTPTPHPPQNQGADAPRSPAEGNQGADAPRSPGDLPRFLSIYSAIAQTMAYAHTRGVIHRDLKPANVMVGSFGEVQVMDWGLAKVLPRGGVVDDARAGKENPPETRIATARSGSATDPTHAGSVMGTPSYMAPEQARGETDLINERADVFALGSILSEILTGSPAFTGRSSGEIVRKAAKGDTADAISRLEGCGAEAELIALAKDCLAAELEDRPRDANVVSERITAYLAGVQERVHAAERERAVAVAKAIEERRRRKVQLALAASVLALTTLGGLSTTYYLQQRAERARLRTEQAAAVDRVVGQAVTLRDQAQANPEDLARWEVALAAVKQSEAAGDELAAPRLLALRAEIQAGLDAAQRDQTLLDRLIDIRSAEADDREGSDTDGAYANAFRQAGIDVAKLPPAEAGDKIKARPPSVAMALAGALDDWAAIRRDRRKDAAGAASLGQAAQSADPDPWRADLRNALDDPDKAVRLARLQAVETQAKYDALGPISLHLLGSGLLNADDPALAESVLRKAQERHPRDVWINYVLAQVLEKQARGDEAIRFYTAARAIRPETAHELAHALEKRGDRDEAVAVFRDLRALRPGNARHLDCLGTALKATGRTREAEAAFEAAVIAGREAVRLTPDSAGAHLHLGNALADTGQVDEAIACYKKAIELDPKHAMPHNNLGGLLQAKGQLDEAIACYKKAIELDPKLAMAHSGLGNVLRDKGQWDEAIACYKKAIELDPKYVNAHNNLGNVLANKGQWDEAIACYKKAIELDPKYVNAHNNLGNVLRFKGQLDEAIACYKKAIELKPKYATAHNNLGVVLRDKGQVDEAIACFKKAIELDPKFAVARTELAKVERLAAARDKLPAFQNGSYTPATNEERLGLAAWCQIKKLNQTAAGLYAAAFAADPKLADDLSTSQRYNAACPAALAAAGQGEDAAQLDDAERTRLRRQALDWLRADLAAWTKLLESGPPQARPAIAQTLNHWQQDTDLAGIRDADALAKLPEEERNEWQALWAEVDALLGMLSAK